MLNEDAYMLSLKFRDMAEVNKNLRSDNTVLQKRVGELETFLDDLFHMMGHSPLPKRDNWGGDWKDAQNKMRATRERFAKYAELADVR